MGQRPEGEHVRVEEDDLCERREPEHVQLCEDGVQVGSAWRQRQ